MFNVKSQYNINRRFNEPPYLFKHKRSKPVYVPGPTLYAGNITVAMQSTRNRKYYFSFVPQFAQKTVSALTSAPQPGHFIAFLSSRIFA